MNTPSLDWSLPYASNRSAVMGRNVVSTSQPLAAQAGLRMLLAGGNAVDAAIAAAMALTVVEPTGCGLGSDGFAIVWDGKELHGLNASGRSPAAWTPEYFEKLGDAVGKHGLLEQPDEENAQSDRQVFPVQAIGPGLRELRHHFLVMQHRTGDEMWKVGDEQYVVDETVFGDLSCIGVGEEGDLREGEEGYAERYENIERRCLAAEEGDDRREEEIGVFEEAKLE